MYTETIHTRATLHSAMDALDRLGKPYEIIKSVQEPDFEKNIQDHFWLIKEVDKTNG